MHYPIEHNTWGPTKKMKCPMSFLSEKYCVPCKILIIELKLGEIQVSIFLGLFKKPGIHVS